MVRPRVREQPHTLRFPLSVCRPRLACPRPRPCRSALRSGARVRSASTLKGVPAVPSDARGLVACAILGLRLSTVPASSFAAALLTPSTSMPCPNWFTRRFRPHALHPCAGLRLPRAPRPVPTGEARGVVCLRPPFVCSPRSTSPRTSKRVCTFVVLRLVCVMVIGTNRADPPVVHGGLAAVHVRGYRTHVLVLNEVPQWEIAAMAAGVEQRDWT